MFQPGELVVYGTTGVCRVEEITTPDMRGADRNKAYYLLKPLQQDGVIYTPVDNEKVSIRPVISGESGGTDRSDPRNPGGGLSRTDSTGPGAALPYCGTEPRLQGFDRTDDVHLCQAPTGGGTEAAAGYGG